MGCLCQSTHCPALAPSVWPLTHSLCWRCPQLKWDAFRAAIACVVQCGHAGGESDVEGVKVILRGLK